MFRITFYKYTYCTVAIVRCDKSTDLSIIPILFVTKWFRVQSFFLIFCLIIALEQIPMSIFYYAAHNLDV
jgi:hypothetical protein